MQAEQSGAVSLQERRQHSVGLVGWTIASVLGVAVVVGVAKLFVDLSKNQPPPPRRKQPWELS